MKTLTKTLAAATLIAAATVAFAQGATTALPSSPAKKELVTKLVNLQMPGAEQMANNMLQQPVGRLFEEARSALQRLPADKREATGKQIEAEFQKFVSEAAPLMKDRLTKVAPAALGKIFEERFSEDELRQLVAWFESPVSKKFNQVAPELSKALQEKLMAEVGPTLDTRFDALRASVGKLLGLSPAPAAAASAAKPASAAKAAKK